MKPIMQKIDPASVSIAAFNSHRWARVALRGSMTIDAVRENPSLWANVQSYPATRLAKGDRIDLVSADGLTIGLDFIVTRTLAGELWLSKPARLVQLEADALYENERYQVQPVGTSFGVYDKRAKHLHGDKTYPTAAAAESALHKLAPVKVA